MDIILGFVVVAVAIVEARIGFIELDLFDQFRTLGA
jgi:hypothetical protein